MDVAPIDTTVAPATTVDALAAAATLDPNAILDAPLLESTFIGTTSSIVDFSPLATFLAATVLAQSQKTNQTQPAPSGTTATTAPSFQQLAESAINFVNAFNNFQNSSDIFTNPLAAAFENALLQEFQTQIAQQTSAGNTQSFINSLATLGITFQGDENPLYPNQFQINWSTLEAAYQANPAQTATTLANAFQGLGAIEDNLMLTQANLTQDQALAQATAQDSVDAQSTLQSTLVEDALLNSLITNLTPAQNVATTAPTTAAALAVAAATTTAATPANAAAATNTDAAEATSTVNAQAIMQPVTIDPLVLTAVAAYRASEVIANPAGERPLANPAAPLNPDIGQVTKVNAINGDSSNGANQGEQNPAHTVAHVNKVEFKVETPVPPVSTGVNISV